MKAITIWQPWASLIAVDAKRFETRSWPTNYRGPIAIHAAARSVKSIMREIFPLGQWSYHPDYNDKLMLEKELRKALSPNGLKLYDLPTGSIVAIADLVECWEIVEVDQSLYGYFRKNQEPSFLRYMSIDNEIMFGNFDKGRFAWQLENVKMLKTPIPAKGKQGLWEWDHPLEEVK